MQLVGPSQAVHPAAVYEGEEQDYTFWQHSRFALPWLLFLLFTFTALLCLTVWQSKSEIKGLRAGIPRDLEPPSTTTSKQGGIAKYKRNIRIAAFFCTFLFSTSALLVFFVDPSAVVRARFNYTLGFLLFITSIVAWVAFGLDLNSEREARICTNNPYQWPQTCESREAIATGVTVFDAGVAIFTLVSSVLLIFYTLTGDWTKEASNPAFYGIAPEQGTLNNGVSRVRKGVLTLALLASLVFAILLIVFTILLHENRDRYVQRDVYNRTVNAGSTTRPGWPTTNTKLRYAVTSFVILTILFNLIPLNSRVIAYVLGFLYVCYGLLSFAAFGVDIRSIEQAKEIPCPVGYDCVYHPYTATTALDFIGGAALLIYVGVEFFWANLVSYYRAILLASALQQE